MAEASDQPMSVDTAEETVSSPAKEDVSSPVGKDTPPAENGDCKEADEEEAGNDKKHKKHKHKHHKEHKEHREKHRRRTKDRGSGDAEDNGDDDAPVDSPSAPAASNVESVAKDGEDDKASEKRSQSRDRDGSRDRDRDRSRDGDRDRRKDERSDRDRDRYRDRDYDRDRGRDRDRDYRRSPPRDRRYDDRRPAYRRSPPRRYDDRRHDSGRSDDRRGDRRYDDRRNWNSRDERRAYDGSRRPDERRGRRSPTFSPSPVRKKKAAPVDDGKPKRFWDGFQWVDADIKTVTAQGGPMSQATRKDRRLYVGNLPVGSGLTEKQLSEFISTSMRQRTMIEATAPDPVLSVWTSPEGTYAFVEFHTVELANQALGLNGIMLLTTALRVSRPNNYQPNIGMDLTSLVGGAAVPAAPSLIPSGLNPSLVAANPALGAVLAAPPPPADSNVLACTNMLTKEELNDKEERDALKEDVTEECSKYGTVEGIKIPVAGNDECNIYVKFDTREAAGVALSKLSGRKFDGRVVGVSAYGVDQFEALVDE